MCGGGGGGSVGLCVVMHVCAHVCVFVYVVCFEYVCVCVSVSSEPFSTVIPNQGPTIPKDWGYYLCIHLIFFYIFSLDRD